MKVTFAYDKEKDIWCLLNKGKSSSNSQTSTKVYEQYLAAFGESLNEETASSFIDIYLAEKGIDIKEHVLKYQREWDKVSEEFEKKATAIFGVSLPCDVTAFLTINNRNPYSIKDNSFFVSVPGYVRKTVMHELWHFYTWYGFGEGEEERLGKQKYNDLKESLTVLLNLECGDLLPQGILDNGYPQHQELREQIVQFWNKDRSMNNLWKYLTTLA